MRLGDLRLRRPAVLATLSAILTLLMMMRPAEHAAATTFSVITAGQGHSCALTSAGAVQCWGYNSDGELGIGTITSPYDQSTVPIPVCATGVWNGTVCSGGSPLTGVYGISQGSTANHTCATIIWLIPECWGYNEDGQLGNGTSQNIALNPGVVICSSTSANCNSTNHILAGITGISAGLGHTCGVDNSGGYVWCWGSNGYGSLGDGTTVTRSIAKRVCATGSGEDCTNGTLLSGVAAIAVGLGSSCALTTAGGVKCWGYNSFGQLGDGTTTNRQLPVDVSGLTSGVTSISAGNTFFCALLTGGGVKCWGSNDYGELGDGTTTSRSTPSQVCATGAWNGTSCNGGSSLSGVSKLAAGTFHACITTTTSSVKCWGSRAFGQLGNSVQDYTSNALNPASWTVPSWGQPQASAISGGGLHTCAIISTYVECWGWNTFGQLGNGTVSDTTTWINQDTDKDGCTDGQELGPSHLFGGQRDPTNFWDFFDTPNDSRTTLSAAMTTTSPTLPAWVGVAAITGFPTADSTHLKTLWIDNEKFQYDNQNSTQGFHITTRSLDGTTLASHSASAPVVSGWRDKMVDSNDTNRVTARYTASGSTSGDPLAPPAAAPAYGTAFDRTHIGPNIWNAGPPDGNMTTADILESARQGGDACSPALYQKAHGESTGTTTTISATFASAPVQNHLLVAIIGMSTSGTINQPSGWSTAINQSGAPGQAIFYKIAGASESSTVTVTTNSSSQLGLQVFEYVGMATSSPLDVTNSATGTSSTPTTGSITTTQNNEVIIAAEVTKAGTSVSAWTSDFTEESDNFNSGSNPAQYGSADNVVQTTGTYSTTTTAGSSAAWRGQIVSFKAATP